MASLGAKLRAHGSRARGSHSDQELVIRQTRSRALFCVFLRRTLMHRSLLPWLLTPLLLPGPARACNCETSFSVCNEVGASDLVFIGTVVSIEPIFLSRWNLSNRASLQLLNDAYNNAQDHPSAAALARLKERYLSILPGLTPGDKRRLQDAKTTNDVVSLFYIALDRGMRVRFNVKTVFKHEDEDDDAKNPKVKDPRGGGKQTEGRKENTSKNVPNKKIAANNRDNASHSADTPQPQSEASFEISTPFGDCGYEFQMGETYLVYANNDESSNVFSTGSCSRTRRLSDAGEDLSYLFFYKDHREESARLEGFTTTNSQSQTEFDQLHDPEFVKSPVGGVIVELKSDRLTRYAETDRNGRFVFDGLREGDYGISEFAGGYPSNTQLLAPPQVLRIEGKGCALKILILPKTDNRPDNPK